MASNHSPLAPQGAAPGRVVVLYGGWSKEREVSLVGGAAVLRGLQESGVDALGLDAGEDWMSQMQALQPDHVFIMLHGSGGEDGVVQGALESIGLPYTGSGVLASALAMDKIRCKQFWFGIGLPTPAFEVIRADSDWAAVLESLGGSAMVKPASEGSSLGMSKADSPDQMGEAWALARQHDEHVLAEAWLSGAEYTVAIVNGKALPTIKLETERVFYDYEAKYIADDTRYLCPCGLSVKQESAMQAMAIKAYESLGCRGWGRVDLMVGGDGQCYVLEVNTVPGMTDHSLVPMAAIADGTSFDNLVLEILLASTSESSSMKARP
jgi:D-alanine-D-alanine ligase